MKKVLILLLCGYVTNVMGDCTPGQYLGWDGSTTSLQTSGTVPSNKRLSETECKQLYSGVLTEYSSSSPLGCYLVGGATVNGRYNHGSNGAGSSCDSDWQCVVKTLEACTNCPAGTFSSTTNAAECAPHTTCTSPDKYVSQQGSSTSDRTCAECAAGTYTSTDNADACIEACPMSAPANGALGTDCVSPLADGATCVPTCDAGYMLSGINSCAGGTLTAAECIAYPEYPSDCLSGQCATAPPALRMPIRSNAVGLAATVIQ